MPLWVGLIALVNQALGYNVDYLNPRLYQEMGPAGVFSCRHFGRQWRGRRQGYAAGPAWTPVAGWGSPDGMKLLSWLRANPDPHHGSAVMRTACDLKAR
jgi:hypothetical protein